MTRRLALLRMLGLLPATRYGSQGQMHRRPDQQTDAPPSAVAPTQAAGIVRARLVLIFGSGPNSGLFVYSGTPAKGHLVAAIVAPGVTSDPYGNTVGAVANFGKWSAAGALLQHFGVDFNGDTFLANTAGLTVQHGHSADGSTWFYSTAGEGLGNLIGSIAPAASTDLAGNAYRAGITSYQAGTPAIFAQLIGGAFAALQLGSGGTSPGQVKSVQNGTGSEMTLSTEQYAADGGANQLNLNSPAAGGILAWTGKAVDLSGVATPSSPVAGNTRLFSDTNGFERMLPGLAGDTDAYQIGETISILGSTFTINSTTPQTIFTKGLGIGTYIIDVWGVYSNTTAADSAQFAFAFTGTATLALVDFTSMTTGTAVVGYLASSTLTATFNGQGVANNQQLRATLTVVVSVAGSLTFTGKELVAANTVSVFGGSRMRTRHIT